ncbi:MAG: DUF2892 domain-containing protein [Lewinella sp.]|nr:DUF2892 domain-containing protein [Lewinella sp.]
MTYNVGRIDRSIRFALGFILLWLGLFILNGIGGAPWGVLVAVLAVAPFYMAISRNCFVFKWLGIHSLSAHELEQYGDPYAG